MHTPLLIIAAFSATGSTIRTSAAVDIQSPAGITITKAVPLELLISGGVPVAFTAAVSVPSRQDSEGDAALLVNASGIVLAASGSGEALSVSVDDGYGVDGGSSEDRRIRTVIAQFN